MSSSVLYMLPVMLGWTYDMATDTPGLPIFPDSEVKRAQEILHYSTDVKYRLVQNAEERRDLLDVSGALALKIKAGLVDVQGSGQYIRDSTDRGNAVELALRLTYRSVTRTLPTWTQPMSDWRTRYGGVQGTHYVRSVTYGAELVASLVFSAKGTYSLQDIHGAVAGAVRAKSFDLDLKGQLQLLQDKLEDRADLRISYYATVPLGGVPHSLEGLFSLLDSFGQQLRESENLGVPLRMELYPLASLDDTFGVHFLISGSLESHLRFLEDRLDDLLRTRKALGNFRGDMPPLLPDALLDKLEDFRTSVDRVLDVFYEVIENLDYSSLQAGLKQVQKATAAYDAGAPSLPHKYYRGFLKLRKQLSKDFSEAAVLGSGASYTHWGKATCGAGEEVTVAGHAYKPKEGADLVCVVSSPYQPQGRPGELTELAAPCAECFSPRASAVVVVPAATKCPSGWRLLYSGLMATSLSSAGLLVCLDGASTDGLAPVTVRCGILPCSTFREGRQLPCVVCAQ